MSRSISRKLLVVAVVASVLATVAALLPLRDIVASSSFRFLIEPTGWEIPYSLIAYSTRDTYARALLVGLCNTLLAGVIAIVGATALGFAVGLAAATGNVVLAAVARLYVDVIRNIPLIIQAMFWYAVVLRLPSPRDAYSLFGMFLSNRGLFLPKPTDPFVASLFITTIVMLGWTIYNCWNRAQQGEPRFRIGVDSTLLVIFAIVSVWSVPEWGAVLPAIALEWPSLAGLNFRGGLRLPLELAALTIALTVYRGAFLAEIFRAGFRAVSAGQLDAAKSLGLSPFVTLIKIRIPLALVSIMPPLASEFMVVLKVTSIGIVVGFADIYSIASSTSSLTGRPLEVIGVMILAYLVINYSLALIMDLANRRFQIPGRERNG